MNTFWWVLKTTNGWLWLAAGILILANAWCAFPTRREWALSLLVPAGLLMVLGHVETFQSAIFSSIHCCTGKVITEEFRVFFFEFESIRMSVLALLAVPVLIRCRDQVKLLSGRGVLSIMPLGIAVLDGSVLIAAALYGFGIFP